MPLLVNAVAGSIRITGSLSPALAGRMTNAAFFSTRPRMPVREADGATHAAARRGPITVNGRTIITYEWGAGPRAALLLHGWSGRAAQFATLIRDLTAEGYRVVSFDAPAHGASPQARTDVRDWVGAAQTLSQTDGPFDLIVGHSFGAFAALAAVRAGVATPRLVTIAGAGTIGAFHDEFERMLRLTPPVRAAFEAAFYRSLGMTRDDASARFDAVAHPLPAHTRLLVVHDAGDPILGAANSARLHAAHADRARLLFTEGLGHNRILGDDQVLDAVLAFATEPAAQIGSARNSSNADSVEKSGAPIDHASTR